MSLNTHEKRFKIPKLYQIAKSEKYETFSVSKLLIWREKWLAGVRYGNPLVGRRMPSGRIS